jgi:hypothetical protein
MQSKMDWRCGSRSTAPLFKCEAPSSNPNPSKKKKNCFPPIPESKLLFKIVLEPGGRGSHLAIWEVKISRIMV